MPAPDKPEPAIRLALATLALSATAAFILACRLVPTTTNTPASPNDHSILHQLLGESRVLIGRSLIRKADAYFHKGVETAGPAAFNDPFRKLAKIVTPDTVAHLEGNDIWEMLPWLKFVTQLDPNNIEAFRITIYWLFRTNRDPAAYQLIREARRLNPLDYRFFQEEARYWLRNRNEPAAGNALDAAINLWPRPLSDNSEDARFDLAWLLAFRAALYEKQGDLSQARPLVQREVDLFPNHAEHRKHLDALNAGQANPQQIARILDYMFKGPAPACNHEQDEHDHEQDADHNHAQH